MVANYCKQTNQAEQIWLAGSQIFHTDLDMYKANNLGKKCYPQLIAQFLCNLRKLVEYLSCTKEVQKMPVLSIKRCTQHMCISLNMIIRLFNNYCSYLKTWNQGDMKLRRIGRDRLNFLSPWFSVALISWVLISCRLDFMSPWFRVIPTAIL